jgi:glycosyltransferase involved in cell wall biosynthesis
MNPRRVLIYGDIDPNVIDGSSVWLQSIATAFALIPNTSVVLLAKQSIHRPELVAPLENIPNLTIVDPVRDGISSEALSPFQVRTLVEDQTLGSFDVVTIRGSRIAREFSFREEPYSNLWVYLTDIPHLAEALTAEDIRGLRDIVRNCRVVLCQTEGLRSLFEELAPDAVGRTWLLPPMIPDPRSVRDQSPIAAPVRLLYAGKFAPDWMTYEMCELPSLVAERGSGATVEMVGDKIHRDPSDPTYRERMEQALRNTPGIDWVGRLTRDDTLLRIAQADIGLAWRSQALSESLELSTKLIEYAAAGVPFVLNRTPAHETLLGREYPLFAESLDDVADRVVECATDADVYGRARSAVADIAGGFSMEQGARRLNEIMGGVCSQNVSTGDVPTKVLVMSHDFKFWDRLETQLKLDRSLAISRDTWDELDRHEVETSLELVSAADTIICEWCGPNAVFASRHKKENQRLIVRLHRFELYRSHPRQVAIDAVDAVVAVNDHYRDLIVSELGWPEEKVLVIPNWVDVSQLDREKIADVRFNLGMIGIAPPSRKRFDRALEILHRLRTIDDRFTLYVKSKQPWEYPYMWADPQEMTASRHFVEILAENSDLNDGVVFDGFGADIGRWLRKIGFVLSTSDDESFHLSPAEGMASGAVPVVRDWPGAATVYDTRWIHNSDDLMVQSIIQSALSEGWESDSAAASAQVGSIDLGEVVDAWHHLIRGNLREASSPWDAGPAIT